MSTSPPLPTRAGYDAWANQYDDEDNPLVLLETGVVPELLPDLQGTRVLDLGCGTGRHSLAMASQGAVVTGVDFSANMLAIASSKAGTAAVEFVQHDLAERLPFDSQAFDIVTCHLVTDHIRDLAGLFSEMNRVCRETGTVINTNMHPAMHLRDVTARFIDPQSGTRISIETQEHSVADYVMSALVAELRIEHLSEHAVDRALSNRSPRAEKYLGWPMLMAMKLRPVESASTSRDRG